jgi:hypothetical protein
MNTRSKKDSPKADPTGPRKSLKKSTFAGLKPYLRMYWIDSNKISNTIKLRILFLISGHFSLLMFFTVKTIKYKTHKMRKTIYPIIKPKEKGRSIILYTISTTAAV